MYQSKIRFFISSREKGSDMLIDCTLTRLVPRGTSVEWIRQKFPFALFTHDMITVVVAVVLVYCDVYSFIYSFFLYLYTKNFGSYFVYHDISQ